jgi:hypothetical protein
LEPLSAVPLRWLAQRWSSKEIRKQRAEDRRLNQIARISSLIVKLLKITNSFHNGGEVFKGAFQRGEQIGKDLKNPWSFCQPVANPGDPIYFDPSELSVLLEIGAVDTFNSVAPIDEMHNSFISLIKEYNRRREDLERELIPASFNDNEGSASGTLAQPEMMRLLPLMYNCNQLISHIRNRATDGKKEASAAMKSVAATQHARLGIKLDFTTDAGETLRAE